MKKNVFDIAKFVFFLLLGLFFVWLSLRNLTVDDKNSLINSLQTANYFWIIPCFLVGVLSHLLRAMRWIIVMEPMGYKPPLSRTFYAVMVGYFVNLALPRLGEVTRCGILNKYEKIPFNKSFGTVVTERAFDLLIFIILFLILVFTQHSLYGEYLDRYFFNPVKEKIPVLDAGFHWFLWSSVFIALLSMLIIYLYRYKLMSVKVIAKIWTVVKGFLSGVRSLTRIRRVMEFILLTIAIWILYFLMVYLCFFSIPQTSSLGPGAGFAVLVFGSIGVIVTPGGIGLYPILVAETLRVYEIAYSYGLAMGWISWAAQAFMIITMGSLSLILLTISKNRNGNEQHNGIENS